MNKFLNSIKIVPVLGLILCTLFSCAKKYNYFFPDGTPGQGGDGPSITVDTSMKSIDRSKYPEARVFPGLVGANVPRVKDTAITLDLDYHYIGASLRISVPPRPQFSVGLYAPPGETIEIDVPEGLHNLAIQIGAWTDNLSGKANPPRDPLIFSRQKLAPGKNYVKNLYGGTIYILSPRPVSQPVTLHFTGAVKQPDFVLNVTDPEEWWKEINKYDVPWLELRSPNCIVTVPRRKFLIKQIKDPTYAVNFWNDAVLYDYYGWEGLSQDADDPINQAPLLPFRAVLDIQISVGYGHNGFPIMVIDNMDWFGTFADSSRLSVGKAWGTFHEFGHNNQQGSTWSLPNLGETTNNLFIYHAARRLALDAGKPGHTYFKLLQGGLSETFREGLDYALHGGNKKFVDDITDPFEALLPFLQLYQTTTPDPSTGYTSGWDFMTALYKRARRAKRLSSNTLDKVDFIYETLCDFTHQDWRHFMHAWGMRVSERSLQMMGDKYPIQDTMYWTYDPVRDTGGYNRIYDPYKNVNWTVADFSSEETTQSEIDAGGGPAGFAIDGNKDTYWHTNWSGSAPAPPHYIEIDMGQELEVAKFYFYQRQTHPDVRINTLFVKVSTDGKSWTDLDKVVTLNVNDKGKQVFTLTAPKTFRFFKLTIPVKSDLNGAIYAALGEVGVIAP